MARRIAIRQTDRSAMPLFGAPPAPPVATACVYCGRRITAASLSGAGRLMLGAGASELAMALAALLEHARAAHPRIWGQVDW